MIMSFSINAEFQSLLIFTTRNEKEKGEEYSPLSDNLEWHKMNSFQSSINDFGHAFWKIFLLRGESDPLFVDIQSAIQYDDRTKVIVGNSQSPNGIIDRIFLSPFCWRKGETEQLAFVMCNRKLDFPLDERGWHINEKLEVGNVALKRRADALIKKEGGSVWIDLFTFSGVPMVSASTISTKNNEKKIIEKEEENESKQRSKGKRRAKKVDEEEIREDVHEEEDDEPEKVSKKRQRRRRKYDREVKEENEENNEKENDEENNEEKVERNEQIDEVEEDKDGGKSIEEEIEEEKEEAIEEERDEGKDEEDNDEEEDDEDNEGKVEEEDGDSGDDGEEDEDENNDEDGEFDSSLSVLDKKRMCRYRLSCYSDRGIELPEKRGGKEQKQENGEYIPSGKRSLGGTKLKIVEVEKKATLKDAAKQAVKKVRQQEAEGEVLREQYAHDGERVLADFWAELERKNRCKYRRSCYSSGKLPKIKQSEILQWLGSLGSSGFWKGGSSKDEEGDEDIKEEQEKIENLNEYERKLFCRYRRSCYEDGKRPKLNNSITSMNKWNFENLIQNLQEWWSELGGKQKYKDFIKINREYDENDYLKPKQNKLECKYRKSCYSSGQLPEELRIDKNEEKQTITKILEGKKVPTSVKELKLFCKYRKSCYIANAAMQQAEIIEKEENKQNITINTLKKTNKYMKNSSPKEEKENKKLPKNSSKRKIEKIKVENEQNKKEKSKNDCFIDKKRNNIKDISKQEGCKFIGRKEENEGILEENENEEVKNKKKKKYILNEEINEIKEEEEDEEGKELKEEKEIKEEEEEIKNKIRKNKKYNIQTKKDLIEDKKRWQRRKSLDEEEPLFDWRILSNLLLNGNKEPRELDIEEWEKISEKERLFRCRQF
uniref:Uncharacterized protein n=1 Tax=Meloidogyne hapla TaxID=6305 RepID=A0A1I8BGN5_MELHA